MSGITIRYTTTDGKQKKADFESDDAVLDLSRQDIASIELPVYLSTFFESHLRDFQSESPDQHNIGIIVDLSENALERISLNCLPFGTDNLFLHDNHFRDVDFDQLTSMKGLKLLDLSHNWMTHVDLSPLSKLSGLQNLTLSGNRLAEVDLSPLRFLRELLTVDLADNQLERLDVSPLGECPNLSTLRLNGNRLREIDVSPLFQCQQLDRFTFDKSTVLLADERFKDAKDVPPALRQAFGKLRWQEMRAEPAPAVMHYPESRAPVVQQMPVVQQVVTREREVREVVLVICPYCGTKNPQGTTRCSTCRGRL